MRILSRSLRRYAEKRAVDRRQLHIVKSLFAMLWADGDASDREIEVASRMMERVGLPLEERLALMDAHLSDPELAGLTSIESVLPDGPSRLEAMELLVTLCFCDQQLAPEEIDILHQLAVSLEITSHQLEEIRHRVQRALS